MKSSLRQTATPQHRSPPRRNDRPHPKTPSSGQHPRRRFLGLAAGAAALPAASRIAWAQAYPTRPITMIVPTTAGGPADILARVLADRMRKSLGQPVIVENVSGANGNIGTGRVARARPDGYTIDLGFLGANVLNGAFYSLQYDVLNDFEPIAPLATLHNILVARQTFPAKDVNELIGWLKANPGKATMGVITASNRLVAAFFRRETGTQFALVPYRGSAPAVQDLLAGQIDLFFGTPDQLPFVRAGSIKAYAVTSDTRSALAPDIPTVGEIGLPALLFTAWYALFAPKGTPRPIISRLNAAAADVLSDLAVQSRLAQVGMITLPRDRQTPEALGAMQRADAAKWWPIIKELGIIP